MNALLSLDTATLLALLALVIVGALLVACIAASLLATDRKIERYINIHAAPNPRYTFPVWLDREREQSASENLRIAFLATGLDAEDAERGMQLSAGRQS